MKVIFAQGNPGTKYAKTRHNVGFILIGGFAKKYKAQFMEKSKFKAYVAKIRVGEEDTLLVRPTTYYNDTGLSLRSIKDFYKLNDSDLLVIHDDLALPFGKLRVRHKGSDAGNNGIKSLNSHLGDTYARMRIGIWNEKRDLMHDVEFVLSKFNTEEQNKIQKLLTPKVSDMIEEFILRGLEDSSYTV